MICTQRLVRRAAEVLLAAVILLAALPARALNDGEPDVDAVTVACRAYLDAQEFAIDLDPFFALRATTRTYRQCAASRDKFLAINGFLTAQVEALAGGLTEAANGCLPPDSICRVVTDFSYDWRTWACLYKRFSTKLETALSAHLQFYVVENEQVELVFSLPAPDVLLADLGETAVFQFQMDYAYLNTLYNTDGEQVPYVLQSLDPTFLASLVYPLDDAYTGALKDTWYQSRSGGTRRHTGTDIVAAKKATIYSCSDGTVTFVGYNAVGGYYVAVLDDFGYLFLYFHMFKNSQMVEKGDRVTAGQPIGLVGNTGNSDANHLHVGLISPERQYVNGYEVLRRVLMFRNLSIDAVPDGRALGR